MVLLYHEKQEASLCGVHAINCLLQGPYLSEVELAEIGRELDAQERSMLGDNALAALASEPGNLDNSGMFSHAVLVKALEHWGLEVINTARQGEREQFNPLRERSSPARCARWR